MAPAFQPNRPSTLGEYGGNGLRVDGHMWNPSSTCCYNLYPDSNSLTNVFIDQVNSLRELAMSQGLSAAVYTETTDVEDELNGFVTYDRQVKKMDFVRVKAANQALVDGVPYIRQGASYSFRTVTPGVTNRYLRHNGSLGVTDVVDVNSAEALKKDSSWKVVAGLADASCLSFESINQPGQFLRHSAYRLRIDPNNNSDLFRQDATFCTRPALDGGGGISLESKNYPGNYIRHANSELWLNALQDTSGFRADASWAPVTGWWHSSVILPVGEWRSLRVLTPGFDNRYLRHSVNLGYTEVVTGASENYVKQDATWRIVTGLADASCYSFESRNYPGNFLRHAASRLRKDALENSDVFRQDATFCTHASASGGVRFAAYNYPYRFLRHYNSEVWIADGRGGDAWNTPGGYDADSRWSVDAAWAP